MKKQLGLLIVLFGVLILTFIACNQRGQQVITWGGPKNIAMLPIIAEEKGFFGDYDLLTNVEYIQTGKQTMDALINGDIDIGIIVETNISYVRFQDNTDLYVLAIIQGKYDDAIVVNSSVIARPDDLIGHDIGVTIATTSHAYAMQFLEYHGISLDSVTLVNMPPPSIQAGLVNGDLVAGSLWQPFRHNAKQGMGPNALEFNDRDAYKGYAILAVRKDFALENMTRLSNFIKALIKAEEYVDENLKQSQQLLAEEISIPLPILKMAWDEYSIKVSLTEELYETILTEAIWISQTDPVFKGKDIPTYDGVLYPDILKDIDSNRVKGLK